MKVYFLLLLFGHSFLFKTADADCTFPSYMTGMWFDNKFRFVEFISNNIMYLSTYSIQNEGTSTNMSCYLNSGNVYVLRTIGTFLRTVSDNTAQYYYYICMDITSISSYSFYYYLKTVEDSNSKRTIPFDETITPTLADVCTTTPSTELFQIMVRDGYQNSALQQCPDPLLGTFLFLFTDNINNQDSTGNITVCDTKKSGNVSYGSGPNSIKVAFSDGNYFGCLKTLTSGSTYYSSIYNFDSTVDSVLTYRFSCLAVAYDKTNVTVSIRAEICEEGQSATMTPQDKSAEPPATSTPGGFLQLTPYITCVPTTDTDDGSNAGLIAAIVVILLLLIAAIVGGILFYKLYWLPKKKREEKWLEEQKKPKSHIGMMKKALEAGVGGNINRNQNDDMGMVDMEDEGIEGSITGVNPDKFREYNNNLKLTSKFIGTSTPVTPSGIDTDFSDPNSVPENGPTREKTKLTSGFSASMQGATINDTPRTTAEQNGHVPSMPSASDTSKQTFNTAGVANGNVPIMGSGGDVPKQSVNTLSVNAAQPTISGGDGSKQQVNAAPPNVAVPAVIENKSSSSGIHREKSFGFVKNDTAINTETSKAQNGTTASGLPYVGKRQPSFAMDKNETVDNSQKSKEKVNTVASVNPFVEGNPTVLQQNQPTAQDKRDEKLRKSVSFATEKPNEKPVIPASNLRDPPPGILSSPKEKATIPGAVESEPAPVITLPREPSNLMGPRDTTLPEIDLKKNSVGSASGKGSDMPDMTNF